MTVQTDGGPLPAQSASDQAKGPDVGAPKVLLLFSPKCHKKSRRASRADFSTETPKNNPVENDVFYGVSQNYVTTWENIVFT